MTLERETKRRDTSETSLPEQAQGKWEKKVENLLKAHPPPKKIYNNSDNPHLELTPINTFIIPFSFPLNA